LTRVQQAVCVANRLAGTPEQAAQALLSCPDTLAAPKDAVAQARAEIETLSSLLNG